MSESVKRSASRINCVSDEDDDFFEVKPRKKRSKASRNHSSAFDSDDEFDGSPRELVPLKKIKTPRLSEPSSIPIERQTTKRLSREERIFQKELEKALEASKRENICDETPSSGSNDSAIELSQGGEGSPEETPSSIVAESEVPRAECSVVLTRVVGDEVLEPEPSISRSSKKRASTGEPPKDDEGSKRSSPKVSIMNSPKRVPMPTAKGIPVTSANRGGPKRVASEGRKTTVASDIIPGPKERASSAKSTFNAFAEFSQRSGIRVGLSRSLSRNNSRRGMENTVEVPERGDAFPPLLQRTCARSGLMPRFSSVLCPLSGSVSTPASSSAYVLSFGSILSQGIRRRIRLSDFDIAEGKLSRKWIGRMGEMVNIHEYFDALVVSCDEEAGVLREKECFETFDQDKDGLLSVTEFIELCRALFRNAEGEFYALEAKQLADIFSLFDVNKDGFIDPAEFKVCWMKWITVVCWPRSALLVIDVQNDFISGSLAICHCPAGHRGEEVVPAVNHLVNTIKFNVVVYSFDWHPENHISFASNARMRQMHPSSKIDGDTATVGDTVVFAGPPATEQKLWPVHCIQGSWGSELHKDLTVAEGAIFVYKGSNPEIDSYSAFWDNNKVSETELHHMLQSRGITDVYCTGIAYDYCVGFTAKHSVEKMYRTILIDDATRGIAMEDIRKTQDFLRSQHSVIVQSEKVPGMVSGRDRNPILGYSCAKKIALEA
ncbi:unnamed protein product [Notodromas monacha]|uniref:nicotinamidase n=1 Tax=Notodromas monacha TaxID=399045 RepID=A0A7R9BMW6_9CRUS|nr:unnamed protein product [Notodromas monacha]CAG0918449.1 unnamed protein product [Notodromas monacha]